MVSSASVGAKNRVGVGPGSGAPSPARAPTWVMPTVLEKRSAASKWLWIARSTAAFPAKSTETLGVRGKAITAS